MPASPAGLVNINSANPMTNLAVTGGTINLAGPNVAAANISGRALLNISIGSVSALTVNGGVTTVGPAASLGSATVGGGLLTLLNANSFSGTTSLSGGTLQIGNGGGTGSLGPGPLHDNAALVFARSDSRPDRCQRHQRQRFGDPGRPRRHDLDRQQYL